MKEYTEYCKQIVTRMVTTQTIALLVYGVMVGLRACRIVNKYR